MKGKTLELTLAIVAVVIFAWYFRAQIKTAFHKTGTAIQGYDSTYITVNQPVYPQTQVPLISYSLNPYNV